MYSVISVKDLRLIAQTHNKELAEMIALTAEVKCEIFFNNYA